MSNEQMTLEQAREVLHEIFRSGDWSDREIAARDTLLNHTAQPTEVDEANELEMYRQWQKTPEGRMPTPLDAWLARARARVQPNLACESVQKRLAAQWGLIHPDDVVTSVGAQPSAKIHELLGRCADLDQQVEVLTEQLQSGQQPSSAQVEPQKYDDTLLPFLELMRKELHANSGKGDRPGWLTMSPQTAVLEIYYHVSKLQKAMRDGNVEAVKEYAADVANMAMMAADVAGALPEYAPPPATSREVPEVEIALLDAAWIALKHAGAICDSVPTKAHLVGDEPLRSVGQLVNGPAEYSESGYALIRDAWEAIDRYLKTVPDTTAKDAAKFRQILARVKERLAAASAGPKEGT